MKGFRQSASRTTSPPRKAETKKHRAGGIRQTENRVNEGLRARPFRKAARVLTAPLDSAIFARASAAAAAIRATYAAKIEDAARDKSLTADQRAAAIKELQRRQKDEAKATRRRIIQEERQTEKARREESKPERPRFDQENTAPRLRPPR